MVTKTCEKCTPARACSPEHLHYTNYLAVALIECDRRGLLVSTKRPAA